MKNLVIIGGGAAGLMAGAAAGEAGIPVMILERRHRPGLKLLMCGNNRCNISHDASADEMLEDYGGEIAVFLKEAVRNFTPEDLRRWFAKQGLRTVVKRERIYPVGENADDVLHLFTDMLRDMKVPLALNMPVKSISGIKDGKWLIQTENGMEITADHVLLATGGISYPKTGSVGDGQRMAAELEHNVTELRPGLAGMETVSQIFNGTRESNIEDAVIRIFSNDGTIIAETRGNILCDGDVLRGSAVFDASRHIAHTRLETFTATADILPSLKQYRGSTLNAILSKSGIPTELAANLNRTFGKMPIEKAISALKNLPLEIKAIRPVKEAIVTAGGISRDHVDPYTMESKLTPGLFFAGEVLDIDGPTGGYNLHAAFATARLAIKEIVRRIKGQQEKSQQRKHGSVTERHTGHHAERSNFHNNGKASPRQERYSRETKKDKWWDDNPRKRYSDPRSGGRHGK